MQRILITGGAGFVGANLAINFAKNANFKVICLDNLRRRGSELNVPRLKTHGIEFVHGDVRQAQDLFEIHAVDWLIECSAEPSVHAGYHQSPKYLLDTNLNGLINCLEYLRQKGGKLIFLSSSRVYPIHSLRSLPLVPKNGRFCLDIKTPTPGLSEQGLDESFPLAGFRSLYGATKLASELLIEEYVHMYQLQATVNRCGVIAGPWQMGKVDQGFMALWVAQHLFEGKLSYMGFGGEGLQVRDVLHVDDLFELIYLQMHDLHAKPYDMFHIAGGLKNSVSLLELTQMVQAITNKKCVISCDPNTRDADIPFYVADISKAKSQYNWQPTREVEKIVVEITEWLNHNQKILKPMFLN